MTRAAWDLSALINAADAQAPLAGVEAVVKRDRLDRRIADAQVGGCRVVGDASGSHAAEHGQENQDLERKGVGRFRVNLRHDGGAAWSGLTAAFLARHGPGFGPQCHRRRLRDGRGAGKQRWNQTGGNDQAAQFGKE